MATATIAFDSLAETAGLPQEIIVTAGELPEEHQVALLLVWLCHRGADRKLRKKYAVKWWSGFFPERIAISAMVAESLSAFSAELSSRLNGAIGAQGDAGASDRYVWQQLLSMPDGLSRRALDALETQATVFATLVRAAQDILREEADGDENEGG